MGNMINVNNPYGTNNKKLTSKLTFQNGESFSARVVAYGDSKDEVTLRMIDGWQFEAQIDENIDLDYKGIRRFVVEGFEDNKLKIKILKSEVALEDNFKGSIDLILEENGLTKADGEVLVKMLKHNIELNKENISKVKTLIDFKENILSDPSKEREFILKYLNSKSIDINSEQGKNLEKVLKESFSKFKELSIEDLMFMMENDLTLDKETIEGFKNIFKEDSKLYDLLKDMERLLAIEDVKQENGIAKDSANIKLEESSIMKTQVLERGSLNEKDVESILSKGIKDTLNMDVNFNKDSISDLMSSLNKFTKENILKSIQEVLKIDNINVENMLIDISKGDFDEEGIRNLSTLINAVEDQILNSKDQIKIELKEIFPKELILTENEVNKLSNFIQKETEPKSFFEFKQNVSNISQNVTETMLSLNNLTGDNLEKILNLVNKENLQSNETVKFLMNFSQSEGKDGLSNFNIDSEQTLSLIMGKNIEENTNQKSLETKGIIYESLAESTTKELLKDSATMIKNQMDIKLNNMKNIVNDVLNKSLDGKDNINNILSFIKNNLSDFKLFNTISNEYYYMDLPIEINYKEYPCRVIIKDKREEGKKIDSKDVKMVVTVKTQFLGEVDGFIKVKNDFMNLEIKCYEKSIKILNMKRESLKESLESLGYNCDIKFSKKEIASDIVSCREFFNDNDFTSLNVMV
ncbi:hypothetical protein [Clostridium algidicarnis]|uniref:hypothetical protein n=1 Tax=Clostridium algidicarnis TaxID=37659 RepID=UPI001C0C71B2|nr:hypothetical protein [Clostridium algidicarnis]MBU3209578.1 hypothetical protein [Clostridium algidicarnis]MBU3227168.1 hypothetical protein [Clostridium algidicarnis]MBU3250693.1 hypothetical protein [Clostridium algidicarnis]